MIIQNFMKYRDIASFVNNIPKTPLVEEYTLADECDGYDDQSQNYKDKCFGCLFCVFNDSTLSAKFENLWGKEFIHQYADSSFKGTPISEPKAKARIKNNTPDLASFTSKKETEHIQKWACGILNNTCSKPNRVSMEVPISNQDYDRDGRLDICSITDDYLIVMESKRTLDYTLDDGRYIEQKVKYTSVIEQATQRYQYLTLIGGKETDLYPTTSKYCSGIVGDKSTRFYKECIENNIQFISAAALWCVACRYLYYGNKYAWDNFLIPLFSDDHCLGLVSAGKVVKQQSGECIIVPIENQ